MGLGDQHTVLQNTVVWKKLSKNCSIKLPLLEVERRVTRKIEKLEDRLT